MSYPARYAILLDGGFVIKKLKKCLGRFPKAEDVVDLVCGGIKGDDHLKDLELLRIYFYHAPPAEGELTNPIDKSKVALSGSQTYRNHRALLDRLELWEDFALRLGEAVERGWKLGPQAMKSLLKTPRPIEARDLVPNIVQKGVDLRLGLDIARLALQKMVRVIVVVTGDSDLVPAFKFARREGIRVYLEHLGHDGIRRDLKAHTDAILNAVDLS